MTGLFLGMSGGISPHSPPSLWNYEFRLDAVNRNFLLFIPANTPSLRAVLSYYSSTVTVNAEGDVHVSETVEGIGKQQFFRPLFGALFNIVKLPQSSSSLTPASTPIPQTAVKHSGSDSRPLTFPWDPGDRYEDIMEEDDQFVEYQLEKEARLMDIFPPPGYFIAGGISGVVSRTATAPLDRLKVYLIAQVGVKDDAVNHAKSGAPVRAAKTAARPLVEATKELWRVGGMRSLFAGKSYEFMRRQRTHNLGNGLNVLKVMPESAIKFGSYEVRI